MTTNPFTNKDGQIEFPLTILRDLVVIWPIKEVNEKKLSTLIIIPDTVIDENLIPNKTGIVLAVGKGFINKKGVFIPNTIKVGQKVAYNNQSPWKVDAVGLDGVTYTLPYMTFGDIFYVVS
jgi:co-chaperonin GroES (HSP10)